MNKFISNIRNLDEFDIGILAITGISIGALIASVKESFVKKFSWLFTLISIIGSVYLILKISDKETVEYDKITPIKYEG